jgi:hypothetical protein
MCDNIDGMGDMGAYEGTLNPLSGNAVGNDSVSRSATTEAAAEAVANGDLSYENLIQLGGKSGTLSVREEEENGEKFYKFGRV